LVQIQRWLLLISLLSLLAVSATGGTAETYYFYHPDQKYGSESLIHPLQYWANGSFDILQLDNRSNRLSDVDFQRGWDVVSHNLGHPLTAIENEGWGNFLRREILPFSTGLSGARFWPNYTLHVLGCGMTYRHMREWYHAHNVSHPAIWAFVTMYSNAFMNEIVEGSFFENEDKLTTDPVADLFFFDPLGMLVFSSDRVSRFFGETLNMRDWSFLVSFDPRRGTLENNGQNFAIKWHPPFWDKTSILYYFGNHGEMGLSREIDNGYSISFAMGVKADQVLNLDRGAQTVTLKGSAGLFLDREGSLMASLHVASAKDYAVRLNIYPGLLKYRGFSPGIFVGTRRNETGDKTRLVTGINFRWPTWQPLGLANRF
jgi:hypothetical protein